MRSVIEINVKPIDHAKYYQVTAKMIDTDKTLPISKRSPTETLEVYPSDEVLYKFCQVLLSMVNAEMLKL